MLQKIQIDKQKTHIYLKFITTKIAEFHKYQPKGR